MVRSIAINRKKAARTTNHQIATTSLTRSSNGNVRARHGMTLIECMIATILLTTALALVLRFQAKTVEAHHEQWIQSQAFLAIVSAREIIGSWDPSQITEDAILAIPMNEELISTDSQPAWVTSVVDIDEPIHGKRVSLGIQWNRSPAQPSEASATLLATKSTDKLEFWVLAQAGEQDPVDEKRANNKRRNEE